MSKPKTKGWVGLGIATIWGLPVTHRFHSAAIIHDANYDAYYLLAGEILFSDISNEPYYYKDEVFERYTQLRRLGEFDRDDYFEDVDNSFYTMCKKLAGDSFWLNLQAELFYRIVRAYSALK